MCLAFSDIAIDLDRDAGLDHRDHAELVGFLAAVINDADVHAVLGVAQRELTSQQQRPARHDVGRIIAGDGDGDDAVGVDAVVEASVTIEIDGDITEA